MPSVDDGAVSGRYQVREPSRQDLVKDCHNVPMAPATLSSQVVDSRPLGAGGNSGSTVELVTLGDGRELVRKRVSPEWDWMARLTDDRGRVPALWESGWFDWLPTAVDHAIVAVEDVDTDGWTLFMRDVSPLLLPGSTRVGADQVQQILTAMDGLHAVPPAEPRIELCSLADRYRLFSPALALREAAGGNHHGEIFTRGWDAFGELVSSEVADAVPDIADDPAELAARLGRCEQTLVHGDLRLGNLGLTGDGIVLIDWGERLGLAPPAVELAWFLGFDAYRLDVPADAVIDGWRETCGDRFDPVALDLALIGALAQLGGIIGFWIVNAQDPDERGVYLAHLRWWDARVRVALQSW